MPSLLLGYTAEFVRQHESFEKAGPLILLNVFLALSIIVVAADKQVSTLTAHAVAGYILVGAVIIAIIGSMLAVRIWRRIQARPQLLRIKYREEESTLSESFLPY